MFLVEDMEVNITSQTHHTHTTHHTPHTPHHTPHTTHHTPHTTKAGSEHDGVQDALLGRVYIGLEAGRGSAIDSLLFFTD